MNRKIIQLKSARNRHWYFNKASYACVGYLCIFLLCSCANEDQLEAKDKISNAVSAGSEQLSGLSVAGLKIKTVSTDSSTDPEIEESLKNSVV